MSEKIKITLTDRPAVLINREEWPVLASARDDWHDNEYEFQANRTEKWILNVRRNVDGRAIVYGIYSYSTNFQNESDQDVRGGVLLENADTREIIQEIKSVANWMIEHTGGDEEREVFARLANECIADLPAEKI